MLKKFSLFLAFAIALGVWSSCKSGSSVSSSAGTSIVISKGKITINGVSITPNWSLSDCKRALGEPERTRDGYNKTHTYDKKAIVLFEKVSNKVASGTVSEIQAHYSVPDPNNVTPNGNFSGKITIDKLKLNSSVSATEMKAKLKKWKVTDSYIEHSYRMASKGLYIYFQYNDNETQLLKVSIGPDKK